MFRLLFDESHSEAWTISSERAARMQPSHPGDASYATAAAGLRGWGCDVIAHETGPLDRAALADTQVLVIAHPSEPEWEATTGLGSPRFSDAELDAIEGWVRDGGGLIVLGETEQPKYGSNLDALIGRFGLGFGNATVQDYAHHHHSSPSWVHARLGDGGRGGSGDLLARVSDLVLYRAGTLNSVNGARVLARAHDTASHPGAPLIVAEAVGEGRVAVLADSDLFGDDCISAHSAAELWENLCFWAAGHGPGGPTTARDTRLPDAWPALRDATNALALLQAPDGSLREDADRDAAWGLVERILPLLVELGLDAAAADLAVWRADGYGKPDFTDALEAFRPDQGRVDGAVHLCFLPMYKQNGSRDTCFEAVAVRVPWPEWIARLEAARYDNPKFVPVELIDATRGYDSECAVLFPEMVSVAGKPVNHFGAIFCDRESARLARVMAQAADLLGINLAPDAAFMLNTPDAAKEAYLLWDLIHDRAHSHGELPFDPFMIRQRSPYWMYSLEELRCDLTAFAEAMALEAEGVRFARFVQYAILFDRLLRFPITGSRVRNYDGLGGQLLFAWLRRRGHVRWEDNRLTIDWAGVGDGVLALRAEIEALYRAGIDRTKLGHWCAAHDLIASVVPVAAGSRWVAGVRDFAEVEDPRPYCDLVLPDEFPLSIFYTSLKKKLDAPVPVPA